MAYIVQAIQDAIRDLDLLGSALLSPQKYEHEGEHEGELERKEAVAAFVEACRHNCTGNLHWSLRTGRYGLASEAWAGGGGSKCSIRLV